MDEPVVAMTLASLLQDVTTVFSSIVTWVGSVANMIASNPILLVSVIATFALISISVFRRLLQIGIG